MHFQTTARATSGPEKRKPRRSRGVDRQGSSGGSMPEHRVRRILELRASPGQHPAYVFTLNTYSMTGDHGALVKLPHRVKPMKTATERLTPPSAAPANPWWRGATIYQIYPRSFLDTNDDGIGDLPGILAKLEYVASLGVEAIWVSPFFKSPMADFGYDIADYRAVDPIFGTLDDFDRLVAKAHQLGLKVIIDQVLSHCSSQHAWFEE